MSEQTVTKTCENSVAGQMNKYCKEQPCSICPCGKYEFPDCVYKLAKLRQEERNET